MAAAAFGRGAAAGFDCGAVLGVGAVFGALTREGGAGRYGKERGEGWGGVWGASPFTLGGPPCQSVDTFPYTPGEEGAESRLPQAGLKRNPSLKKCEGSDQASFNHPEVGRSGYSRQGPPPPKGEGGGGETEIGV